MSFSYLNCLDNSLKNELSRQIEFCRRDLVMILFILDSWSGDQDPAGDMDDRPDAGDHFQKTPLELLSQAQRYRTILNKILPYPDL